MNTPIYNVGEDEVYGLDRVDTLHADFFIYNYENYGYEGTGFALWRTDSKYGYSYLGHCSCNGPLEDINSIMYTREEIEKLRSNNNLGWDRADAVIEKLNELEEAEAR